MSNRFDELRTARKEGPPQHRSSTSNNMSDRFHELRTARREGHPLHQPNISRKRDDTTKEPHPEFRYRRSTPHHIEHYRQEEVDEAYPKGDSPLIDALRRRIRSSPPPRTRAPTPHSRASAPRITKKTVRWAEPLEQPTPEKIGSEGKKGDSEAPKEDREETQKDAQFCTIRRYRPSSIPRPKRSGSGAEISKPSCSDRRPTPSFTIELVLAPQAGQSLQRPLSPLIPQAMPAPLRLSPIKTSTRRAANTIRPSASAPTVQARPSARNFSFDDQPEVITLGPDRRPSQGQHVPSIIQETLSSSQPTSSYLKEKPRRHGTVRAPQSNAKPASAADETESSTPSLSSSSSSTSSFHTAKSFWSDISDSSKIRDSSYSKSPSPIKPGPGPSDVTLASDRATTASSPSKIPVSKIPIPSSASSSSFNATKAFWSEISRSSSCGAIIDGTEDVKPPYGPSAVGGREKMCKTSKVTELSRYTVNRPVNDSPKAQSSISRIPISRFEGGFVGLDRFKSRIPVAFTASYHVTRTQQSQYVPLRVVSGVSACRSGVKPPVDAGSSVSGTGSTSSSSFQTAKSHHSVGSGSDAPTPAFKPKTKSTANTASGLPSSDSVQVEDTPSLQAQMWHDVLKLCTSESSSGLPDCDCDDCIWSRQDDLDGCSMVAHVDDGECRER